MSPSEIRMEQLASRSRFSAIGGRDDQLPTHHLGHHPSSCLLLICQLGDVDLSGASYAMFGYNTPNWVSSRLLPARVRVLNRMWMAFLTSFTSGLNGQQLVHALGMVFAVRMRLRSHAISIQLLDDIHCTTVDTLPAVVNIWHQTC